MSEQTPPGSTPQRKIDPRNQLNDLTGAEWVHFLSSVKLTAYPPRGAESYAHHLRREHPSPKPPPLMREIIEYFTKRGGVVLDPFVGVGGTLLGASLAGRSAVGIDLSTRWQLLYSTVCQELNLAPQTYLVGDARNLHQLLADYPRFDAIVTDPPYGDMLSRPQTGEAAKRTGKRTATPFTESTQDLGNLPRDQFFVDLVAILAAAVAHLRPGGYLVVFCKDLQPTGKEINMLHADLAKAIVGIENLEYRGMKIWVDQTIRLYPFGYPFGFVANQIHQYYLIFRKSS